MIRSAANFFEFLRLFYQHAGWRLPALLVLIAVGGIVEAIGIVTLLPLLNAAVGESANNEVAGLAIQALAVFGIVPSILNLLLVIVGVFVLRGGLEFFSTYFMSCIIVGIRRRVQADLTRRFCDMAFPYYTAHSAGWFNNILVAEVARFVASMRSFSLVSVSLINAVVLLPVALSMKAEVTLTIFVAAALALLSLRGVIRRTAGHSREQTRLQGLLNAMFIQLIQAFIYLKATYSTVAANSHVIDTIDRLARTELRIRRLSAFIAAIKDPIAVVILAAFIYYEVEVLGGTLSEVIVVGLVLYRMLIQLVSLAPQLQVFNQTIGGVFAVRDVLSELDRHLETGVRGQPPDLEAPIMFRDVSFRHGSEPILQNLNVELRPNQMVGVVGESGAGKTTFFHLLTGLLRPQEGRIEIGGIPYERIDLQALRRQIGYVTQEPAIFDDTVANNISLWQCPTDDAACMKRVHTAAMLARCDGFVESLEQGYQTRVGDRGIRLSGGERQRIAIARELFKDPRLLIFDEASSALDAHSEHYVQESINRMHGDRTILIITHRLTSVRNCDHIYVFSNGRIVEDGSFELLFNRPDSRFRRMCNEQGISA